MAKYKGHDRAVFLDGYAQGWADGVQSMVVKLAPGETLVAKDRPALRYTDADPVAYRPGRVRAAKPAGRYNPGPAHLGGSGAEFIKNGAGRHPSPAELAILGPRKPCDGESYCPVAPGCHICGLTREELAILDKARGVK
jgi:hypothetical protein